ncbi:MAG: 5'/3'-nucleotidase SurE [Polyangiaceae bacterium]
MSRPLILLANDDGFRAEGLQALRGALSSFAEVIVCAPASEQSAKSHSLTLHRPLRLIQHEPGVFSVDGTPADSVYIALHAGDRVVPRRPDLVVSGLNHGVNLGDDVFYSGTVAAAREAALKGLPAIAVSADGRADRASAVKVSTDLARALLSAAPRELTLLNVNFPAGSEWNIAATRLGTRRYLDAVEFRHDPRGKEYLWIGGSGVEHNTLAGSDTEAFDRGEVGVTPLVLDLWHSGHQELAEQVVAEATR